VHFPQEGIAIERFRGTALFAFDQGGAEGFEMGLPLLEQSQSRADDFAGRAELAGCDPLADKGLEMIAENDGGVLRHTYRSMDTNTWYRCFLVLARQPDGATETLGGLFRVFQQPFGLQHRDDAALLRDIEQGGR